MSRTVSLSQSGKVNTEQNIFWKSETAIERILIAAVAFFIWKAAFLPALLIAYVAFEGMLLFGRLYLKEGIIIGAQVVITGVLLMFFHELPVADANYYAEEGKPYLPSIGIIVAVTFLVYLGLHILSRVPLIIAIYVVAADAYIIMQFIYGTETSKVVIILLLLLSFVELSRLIAYAFGKNRDVTLRYRWMFFFILMEILVFAVPEREEPIDWSFVARIGYGIRDGFETLAENTGYYLSGIGSGTIYQSGYSGLSGNVGNLSGNTREEIYVTTTATPDSLYLTGKIMSDSDNDISDDIKGTKLLDFLYALYSHDVGREEAKCYGKIVNLSVELGYLRTKDIIRPENCLRIEYGKRDDKNREGTEFNRTHKKGDKYDTTYLNVDYGSRYLEQIMRNPASVPWPSYDEMEEYCSHLFDYQLSRTISEGEYLKWASEKKDLQQYLDEGDLVTPRMRELAETITKDADNDYDICRAVERYLRQYKYSTRIQNTISDDEKNENFIDEFLFETGKGYCVHFANSMVELLRLSGIPARCVEGYCYAFPENKYGRFAITGDRAHVWVEAYLDGIGWVPFEPTAARRTSIDTGWNILMPEPLTEQEKEAVIEDTDDQNYVPQIPDEVVVKANEEELDNGSSEKRVINVMLLLKTLGMIVVGLLIYGVVMLIVIYIFKKLRYRSSPLPGKLEKNMKDILWLMNREFVPDGQAMLVLEDYLPNIPDSETVRGDRLEKTDLKELSGYIFNVYYRQRFAGRDATGAEVRDAEYLKKYLFARYLRRKILRKGKN